MARIPTANKRQVQDQISQTRGIQAKGPDTTRKVNLGANIAGAVAEVSQIVDRERLKAEATQETEFNRIMRDKKIAMLHDKDEGFLKEKGKGAAENHKTYAEKYSSFGEETIAKYAGTSDRLKEKLSLAKKQFESDYNNTSIKHISREMEVYEDGVFSAEMASLSQETLVDPSTVGKNLQEQKDLIYGKKDKAGNVISPGFADRKGLSKEKADQMYLGATTKVHSGQVHKLINEGDDQLAKDYLDVAEKSKEIDGEELVKLRKLVDAGSLRGESQRETDKILGAGLGEKESLDQARAIKDPEKRDAVVTRVKNRFNENKQIERVEKEENYQDIALTIEKTLSMDSIPPARLDALTHSERTGLKKYLAKKVSGEDIKTDFKVYYQLEQLSANNRSAFKNANLWKHRHELSDSDFKRMSSIQAGLRKNKEADSKLLDGIETKSNIVNSALNGMKIKYGQKANTEQNLQASLFRKKVDDLIIDKQEELGRKVGTKEVRQIVEDLRVEVITDKGFFMDTKKRIFELSPEDKDLSIDFDDIPSRDRSLIKNAIQRKGGIVNEEEITRYYINGLNARIK